MNQKIECNNQTKFDKIVEDGDIPVVKGYLSGGYGIYKKCKVIIAEECISYFYVKNKVRVEFQVTDKSKPVIKVWYGSKATVYAKDRTEVDLHVDDSSKVKLIASGNSITHIKSTYGTKTEVKTKDNAIVWGVEIRGYVTGNITRIDTAEDWCLYYGVEIINGIALLGKAVEYDYGSVRTSTKTWKRVRYIPGTIPVADDWDGGVVECGLGLHFSPDVDMASSFNYPHHRMICPVNLVDIAVNPDGSMPYKCKAKGCCEPIWEVNENGDPIDESNKAIRDAFYKKHGGEE